MTDQLSLFPERDIPKTKEGIESSDFNALDEMFEANPRFRNSHEYLRILTFIARFPKYSALNGLLLYLQNPRATYVATTGTWMKQFDRRPLYDARPMIILAPMSPVLFLYDLKDTEGETFPDVLLKPTEVKDRIPLEVYERTLDNCRVHGIDIRSDRTLSDDAPGVVPLTYDRRQSFEGLQIDPRMKYMIILNEGASLSDKYTDLVRELAHIFCGHVGIDPLAWWQDRSGIEGQTAELESESVAFLVSRRRGLRAASDRLLTRSLPDDRQMPPLGMNCIFHSTNYIEQMGKSAWKEPKKGSRYLPAGR